MCSLPTKLETQILENGVPNEDIIVRRFKSVVLPVEFGTHVAREIMEYFLAHSHFESEREH